MPLKIKICGITSPKDAQAAVQAGADALGFMFFAKSPRHVSADQVARIVRDLPPFVARVGVFVNAPIDQLQAAVDQCGLDTLQFHGDESPEYCAQAKVRACKRIKAVRIKDRATLDVLNDYTPQVDAFLLDSYVAGQRGGTGAAFNWDLAVDAKHCGRPVILAGGLNPDNIARAVAHVRPYGVDVSSGVETSPGCKDAPKMRALVAAARQAAGQEA